MKSYNEFRADFFRGKSKEEIANTLADIKSQGWKGLKEYWKGMKKSASK